MLSQLWFKKASTVVITRGTNKILMSRISCKICDVYYISSGIVLFVNNSQNVLIPLATRGDDPSGGKWLTSVSSGHLKMRTSETQCNPHSNMSETNRALNAKRGQLPSNSAHKEYRYNVELLMANLI